MSNSIDAGANEVSISISIDEFTNPSTLKLVFIDNGEGFTDIRFEKFSKLLEVEDNLHKGIGRLVFLSYFNKVEIESQYEPNAVRKFTYDANFEKSNSKIGKTKEKLDTYTKMEFSEYYLKKIAKVEYITPKDLLLRLIEEFYPKFYTMKNNGKAFKLSIKLDVKKADNRINIDLNEEIFELKDLEDLKVIPIDLGQIKLFENSELHYSIKETVNPTSIISALSIDGRTYKLDVVSSENLPYGFDFVFLLVSSFFDGKVNASRQELTIKENELTLIKKVLRSKITELLMQEVPLVLENTRHVRASLHNNYPHLVGYFEDESIGYIKREETLKKAQDKFFKDQRDVLDGNSLSDENFKLSVDLSARSLTEYILYRSKIIEKMKSLKSGDSEEVLHNLIVPKGKVLLQEDFITDIFTNNSWLLDDKFMSFNTILSDKEMTQVIKTITQEETAKITGEPDIAVILNGALDSSKKVDVVIVELKKRGIKLEDAYTSIVQLRKRAEKLVKYYPNKIQRIWFYAVVEFNDELKLSLINDEFAELFSTDSVYYRPFDIQSSLTDTSKVSVGFFVMSLDSIIGDAEARNDTFLKILKHSISEAVNLNNTSSNS